MKTFFIAKLIIIYFISAGAGMLCAYVSSLLFGHDYEMYGIVHSFLFVILFYFILPRDYKIEVLAFILLFPQLMGERFYEFFFFEGTDIFDTSAYLISFWAGGLVCLFLYIARPELKED